MLSQGVMIMKYQAIEQLIISCMLMKMGSYANHQQLKAKDKLQTIMIDKNARLISFFLKVI